MDVPISKRDIEYLIDAAEKTSFDDDIPKYIPYRLFEEARETLERFKNDQTSLIGPAENTADLESRISEGLSDITDNPECPEGYKENDSTIQVLVKFYRKYNEDNRIDEIRQVDEKHKKWGILGPNFQELEGRSAMRERILTISKALRTALKMLSRVARGDIPENEIPNEFLQDTEYDEEGSNETYNIIPFDDRPDLLPEVKEAIDSLKCGIDALPSSIRGRDVLDCLQKWFGFQESSVSNQRENIVNLLSNEQMRPFTPGEHGTALEAALEKVFSRTLDNYTKWCSYLSIKPIWKNTDENATGEDENVISKDENATGEDENVISKDKKILYISLYYLIWGEAANVRFLPECLCYIFHHMSEQLDKYLRLNRGSLIEQVPQPLYEGSFIDQVIQPLYKVIAAEAEINKKRDTSHSKWRNYDDFNEYFWSKDCLELRWPLNGSDSPFFSPPKGSTTVFGKTSFVERRTFLHLYHSFHRMWIFHVMMFEALVIFAFNDGELNLKTLTETLTVTYFLMKLIQSMFDIWLKYGGAYSKTSRIDVMQTVIRFIGFMSATLNICFSHMKCLQEMTSSNSQVSLSFEFQVYFVSRCISTSFSIFRNLEDWEDWNNWRNCESVPVKEGVAVVGVVAAEGGGAAAEGGGVAAEGGGGAAEGGGVAAAEGGGVAAAEGGGVAAEGGGVAAEGGGVAAAEGGGVGAEGGGVGAEEGGVATAEGGVAAVEEGVPVEEKSWEAWWNKELDHIRTPAGRIIETILSLRFFIFPLVVGYKLDVQGLKNSLSNCVIPWIFLVGILFAHEVLYKKPAIRFFSNKKPEIHLFYNQLATIGALAIAYYYSAFGDMLAFTIAIITNVWGFISFFPNNRVATIGALAIAYYYSAFGDMLAFFIAIITTVWGFLSICVACKPVLEIFGLWTPVKYLAWMCDTGMGALMFKIANMFSQRSIKQYLVRNMFDQNISELLHNSSGVGKEKDSDIINNFSW